MKIPLKLSLVLSVLICAQAVSNIYFQYNCSGGGNTCGDNHCCAGVSFFGRLAPIYSARGSGTYFSTAIEVFDSSDCGTYISSSSGCYSDSSKTLYAAMTDNIDPKPPAHPCPIGVKCASPWGGHIMIEGKIHNGQVMKLQSNKIPDSYIYTDAISIKTYYILLTNPAAKRLGRSHPSTFRLDYFKEHYDILETRDEDDNLVEMTFNPKN